MARQTSQVEIQGKQLSLSNLQKVMYPATGFTKAQVIDYYTRISPVLLPHLRGRPLTLKRYPNGVEAPFFYEKNCPQHRPPWVPTLKIWSRHNDRFMDFCDCRDLPTLVWAANLADLELHTSLSRGGDMERPTMMVFDLDPGEPAAMLQCCEVGLLLRRALDALGLQSFAKTSGSKGLQVYVPLNTPVSYVGTRGRPGTKDFSRAMAELLERERPELVVSNMKKSLRARKVMVDWSQNVVHTITL